MLQTRTEHPIDHPFNAIDRAVYIADNLDFLRALNDECIDLVCIDPPFDKNETFAADKIKPPLAPAEQDTELRLMAKWGVRSAQDAADAGLEWPLDSRIKGGYKDIWRWESDIHQDWVDTLEKAHPAIHSLIETTRLTHSDGRAAYLCFMAIRLIEIRRVLKPTGSLYLHCDHTANGYLRQLLDAVFGAQNFRNEIVWAYQRWTGATKWFQRMHDTILFYAKSESATFNPLQEPYSDKSKHKARRHSRFDSDGKIHQRYTDDASRQKSMRDVWEISYLNSQAHERTGYPTQKPVELAERIIAASTNPGDVVLDCFAGCAYVPVAAERLKRRWAACDMNPRAWTVLKRQFSKPSLALLRCSDETTGQQVIASEPVVTVHGPRELPKRTSPESALELKPFAPAERRYKKPSLMSEQEMLTELLEISGYAAWCCGFANRRPDGAIVKTTRNFHLDHLEPKSADGINEITNRAPMCPHHNIRKSARLINLRAYRQELWDAGEMLADTEEDLVDLSHAQMKVLDIYVKYRNLRAPQTAMPV